MVCDWARVAFESAVLRASGFWFGDKISGTRGLGVDVIDYRDYEFGDDLRRVEWRLTSRTPWYEEPKLIVKEYSEERSLEALVVVDASASMTSGDKLASAVYTSSLVSSVLLRLGDRVYVLVVGCEESIMGRVDTPQLLGLIARLVCSCRHGKASLGNIPLAKGRKILVLATDYGYPLEEYQRLALAAKYSGWSLLPILHTFREELEPPLGSYLLADPEGDGLVAEVRREAIREHVTRVDNMLASLGYPPVRVFGVKDAESKASRIVAALIHQRSRVYK